MVKGVVLQKLRLKCPSHFYGRSKKLPEVETLGKQKKCPQLDWAGRLWKCVNTEFVWDKVQMGGFRQGGHLFTSRAVRLRECPLRELRMYFVLNGIHLPTCHYLYFQRYYCSRTYSSFTPHQSYRWYISWRESWCFCTILYMNIGRFPFDQKFRFEVPER